MSGFCIFKFSFLPAKGKTLLGSINKYLAF